MTGKDMRGKPIDAPARLGAIPAADHGTYDGSLTLCKICRSELFAEDRRFARVKERPCPELPRRQSTDSHPPTRRGPHRYGPRPPSRQLAVLPRRMQGPRPSGR